MVSGVVTTSRRALMPFDILSCRVEGFVLLLAVTRREL
jgi:hypothetical protein